MLVYFEQIVSKPVTVFVWKIVEKVIKCCSKFLECGGCRVFTHNTHDERKVT